MKVDIYIQGKTKNPARLERAQARWLIVCALNNGTQEKRDGVVQLSNATTKRAVLTAFLTALQKFNKAAVLKIYISDDFVRSVLINGWLSRWKSNDWRRIRQNEEVKHLDLWQQIALQLNKHAVSFANGEELNNRTLKEMEWRLNNVGC